MSDASGAAVASIRDALDQLISGDPDEGHLAQVALVTLSGGEPLDSLAQTLTQRQVERFLWHELAMWWWAGTDDKARVARALAQVLRGVGLGRYASICEASQTTAVFAAFDDSLASGAAARGRAARASQVFVPDTAALAWSDCPGPREVAIRWELMDRLELAVAAGAIAASDHEARCRFVDAELLAPREELLGCCRRDEILTERLGT